MRIQVQLVKSLTAPARIAIAVWLFLCLPSLQANEPVADSGALVDRVSRKRSLKAISGGKPIVVAFIDLQTLASNPVYAAMNQLEKEFRSQGIAFIAVYSDETVSVPDAASHASDIDLSWCVLKDVEGKFAEAVGITTLPAFAVLDSQLRRIYRGELGTPGNKMGNTPATGAILALQETLAGMPASVPEGDMNGRLIEKTPERSQRYRSFSEHVAPILRQRCQGCHREGGRAPFPLVTYRDLTNRAAAVEEAITVRRMPPWRVDGRFGKFTNDSRLTPPERTILADWFASGIDPGDLSKWARDYVTPTQPVMDNPDATIALPKNVPIKPADGRALTYIEVPASVTDEVFKEDHWVQEFECRLANPKGIEHFRTFIFPPGQKATFDNLANASAIFSRDGAQPVLAFPPGRALKLDAGSRVLLQMRIASDVDASKIQPMLLLRYATEPPEKEIRVISLLPREISIPPEDPNASAQMALTLAKGVEFVGALTQMNGRGKELRLSMETSREGDETRLFSIPRYDDRWPSVLWWEQLPELPQDTTLRTEARFDNSRLNPVNPDPKQSPKLGFGADQETMAVWLYVAMKPSLWGSGPLLIDPEAARMVGRTFVLRDPIDWTFSGPLAAESRVEIPEGASQGRFRLEISQNARNEARQLQARSPTFAVQSGKRYLVRFHAKADDERKLDAVLIDSGTSAALVSRAVSIQLTTNWRDYFIEFTSARASSSAALDLFAGASKAAIDIDRLTMEETNLAQATPITVQGSREGSMMIEPIEGFENQYRIEQSADAGEREYQAKIYTSPLEIAEGERFRVQFRARADRLRSLILTVSEEKPPCQNLGMFRSITLHRQWQSFDFQEVAKVTGKGTIMLFVGGDSVPFEVSNFSLTKVTGKEAVEDNP